MPYAPCWCPYSSYLCDVTLKSEDGKEFPCHKGVLCARLGKVLPRVHKDLILIDGGCHICYYFMCFNIFRLFFQNTSTVCSETPGLRCARCLFLFRTTMFIRLQKDALALMTCVLRPPQATSCTALELPTSSEILQVILEYIYTDESPTIKGIFSNNAVTP